MMQESDPEMMPYVIRIRQEKNGPEVNFATQIPFEGTTSLLFLPQPLQLEFSPRFFSSVARVPPIRSLQKE